MKYLLIALSLFAGVLAWQLWAAQPWASGVTLSVQQNCGPDCYRFRANNVPYNEGGYAYFWFFDDGSFSMEPMPEHRFQTAGNHDVYLELTPLYEKGDKPTRMYVSGTINTSTTHTEPESPTGMLSLVSNRAPRAGDTITYVLTYGRLCNEQVPPQGLIVNYPTAQLTLLENKFFNGESVTSSTAGQLDYTLSTATNGLAKRIFLTFAVQETATVSELVEISAELDFRDRGPECDNGQISFIQEVVLSHDPNYIISDKDLICGQVKPGDPMTYTVHFQNIGAGPAQEIEVRSFLPAFFLESSVSTIYPSGISHSVSPDGELVWTLSGPLRGTAEAGYGSTFFDEDTKDSVVFSAVFRSDINPPVFLKPCQAVFNQAEIVFDCNPPIRTNFYKTSINCGEPNAQEPCICETDSLFVVDSLRYEGTAVEIGSGATGGSVVWYPPAYISDPFDPTPDVTPARAITYVGTMGDFCTRQTEFYRVDIPCDLSMTVNVQLPECGTGAVTKGNITATAVSGYAPADLEWNWECPGAGGVVSGNQLSLNDVQPGVYYITVKNKISGCWVEEMAIVPAICPPGGGIFRIFVYVFVSVLALFGVFFWFIRKRKRRPK